MMICIWLEKLCFSRGENQFLFGFLELGYSELEASVPISQHVLFIQVDRGANSGSMQSQTHTNFKTKVDFSGVFFLSLYNKLQMPTTDTCSMKRLKPGLSDAYHFPSAES